MSEVGRDRLQPVSLVVRRTIRANAERLFGAWTQPAQFLAWFGPPGVTCIQADVDLRVGGRYRLGNRLPDGNMVWIAGEFERILPPHELVYTWYVEPAEAAVERVTVRFQQNELATDVTVIHELIRDRAIRDQHALGWEGCLDRLAVLTSRDSIP